MASLASGQCFKIELVLLGQLIVLRLKLLLLFSQFDVGGAGRAATDGQKAERGNQPKAVIIFAGGFGRVQRWHVNLILIDGVERRQRSRRFIAPLHSSSELNFITAFCIMAGSVARWSIAWVTAL